MITSKFQVQQRGWRKFVADPYSMPATNKWYRLTAIAKNLTCHDLFGWDQIVTSHEISNATCFEHAHLGWIACYLGKMQINASKVQGSMGGEDMLLVRNRPEKEEQLKFEPGAVRLSQTVPARLIQTVAPVMKLLLQSAIVDPLLRQNSTQSLHHNQPKSWSKASNITLFVKRGAYANPCMSMISMYNVWLVLRMFRIHPDHRPRLQIVWLDGHASTSLDEIWYHLFQSPPIHLQRILASSATSETENNPNNTLHQFQHAIVVNTKSAMADEGLWRHRWNKNTSASQGCFNSDDHTSASSNTLIQFRDFVLERYGVQRPKQRRNSSHLLLTLLVRQDYKAHPRSDGRTDRTLANVTRDALYLQSLYPNHTIQIVSFERLSFRQQILIMVQTDLFVAVHGAGNVHALFLPPGATFVEYIPKGFESRQRFKYLAECVLANITYIAERATVVHRDHESQKITVQLQPLAKSTQIPPVAKRKTIQPRKNVIRHTGRNLRE